MSRRVCMTAPGSRFNSFFFETMKRRKAIIIFCLICVAVWFAGGQVRISSVAASRKPAKPAPTPQTLSVPPDSPRWLLEGVAKPIEYQGRMAMLLNGGGATLKDFEMRDGVIDVDVSTPAIRGFFGIQFRIDKPGLNAEWVYLRLAQV